MGNEMPVFFNGVVKWFREDLLKTLIVVVLIAAVIALAAIISRFGSKIIIETIHKSGEKRGKRNARFNTIGTLLASLFKYVVWFFGILAVCLFLGLGSTVSTLLATAGIGGIAIGFGAQSLITDFLSGIMLTTDNQYDVGDVITVAGVTGVVEELRTRSTVLKSFTGELHTISNGSISAVTNLSRADSLAVSEVYVNSSEDFDRVKGLLEGAAALAVRGDDNVTEAPQVLGIMSFSERGMMCIRTICRTKPMQHYGVERAMRRCQLQALQAAGVSLAPGAPANAELRNNG